MATDVQRFFDEYARAAAGQDPQDVAAFHDDHVVHAGPRRTLGFGNDARYRSWLTDMLDHNASLGLVSLEPAGVGSYDLGPALVLATVQWRARYDRQDRPVETTVTYVLRRAPDGLRIVCAAAHEDQDEAVRRLGIEPRPRPRASTQRPTTGKARKPRPGEPPGPRLQQPGPGQGDGQ